jgi:hypothetical protein
MSVPLFTPQATRAGGDVMSYQLPLRQSGDSGQRRNRRDSIERFAAASAARVDHQETFINITLWTRSRRRALAIVGVDGI